jgi:hypothetical protein
VSENFAKKVISTFGEPYLWDLRVSILRHYKSCALLIRKEYGSQEEATKAAIATKLGLVKKLDFLTYPVIFLGFSFRFFLNFFPIFDCPIFCTF